LVIAPGAGSPSCISRKSSKSLQSETLDRRVEQIAATACLHAGIVDQAGEGAESRPRRIDEPAMAVPSASLGAASFTYY